MAQIKIGDPHGLFRVFVGLVSSVGYNYGTAGGSPSQGTVLAPYNIRYAQNAEINLPDRTVVDFTGGDIWTGSYVYGITSLGTFQLTTSTIDADLIAMLSASAVDQTLNTRHSYFSDNIMRATPPQAFMMTVFRIQSKETGSKGANKFLTCLLPRTWVTPKGVSGAPSFQSAGTYGFTLVPTVGDRFPWGPLFSSTSMSLEEDESPTIWIITDNPIHTVGMIAEAGPTESIVMTYKPVDFDYSTPDTETQPVSVYIDGAPEDANSVTQSTATVVTTADGGAAFTGGEFIGIFYETEYETP